MPDFTLPSITEGPNGQMVVNWSYRDLALPFSEGGPSREEWESLKRRGFLGVVPSPNTSERAA